MSEPKVVVIGCNSNGGLYKDFESPSYAEAVGWAKGRCSTAGNPYIVIERLKDGECGRVVIFGRDKDMKAVEWKFWEE